MLHASGTAVEQCECIYLFIIVYFLWSSSRVALGGPPNYSTHVRREGQGCHTVVELCHDGVAWRRMASPSEMYRLYRDNLRGLGLVTPSDSVPVGGRRDESSNLGKILGSFCFCFCFLVVFVVAFFFRPGKARGRCAREVCESVVVSEQDLMKLGELWESAGDKTDGVGRAGGGGGDLSENRVCLR